MFLFSYVEIIWPRANLNNFYDKVLIKKQIAILPIIMDFVLIF